MWTWLRRWFPRQASVVPFVQPPPSGLALLNTGICPDCATSMFIEGPSGGAAMNIKCAGCGSKFWFAPPFTPERIDNDDQFYTREPIDLREVMHP